jgi:hypothetical protein
MSHTLHGTVPQCPCSARNRWCSYRQGVDHLRERPKATSRDRIADVTTVITSLYGNKTDLRIKVRCSQFGALDHVFAPPHVYRQPVPRYQRM